MNSTRRVAVLGGIRIPFARQNGPLGSVDRDKLNVRGGSIAAGHPFGGTGGKIVAVMAKLLNEKGSGRGLISICAAGGLGVTAIMEAA